MTLPTLAAYLDGLDKSARTANAAEDTFRREIVTRIRALEQERAFAFRRLNLMRAVVAAVSGAKDEAEAIAMGSSAFLRELEWNGATESQRQTLERFLPVVRAVWGVAQTEDDRLKIDSVGSELASFEKWFAGNRNGPFLAMMEREVVELPLVEV